ncbi:MAG: capsular polysaccharide biosynthesis protein [Proteobacteria bacterium]|nr:capsular polysaccharide biosynthesis protein [Pseudomonadota bacterium]
MGISRSHMVIGVFSRRLSQVPYLAAFLGADRVVWLPSGLPAGWRAGRLAAIAGWGHRPTADRARAFAADQGLPYLALEDGFLRSLELASRAAPPLSLAVDDIGIYYDASRPSRLEVMLNDVGAISKADLTRADEAMAAIHRHGLSKYNHGTEAFVVPGRAGRRVLLADQTRDDMSVLLGRGDEAAFRCMLESALEENPGADILVKLHPETVAGRKRGYLAEMDLPRGVAAIAEPVNPLALLEGCEKVYTVSSQLGFEALTMGLPVSCHGLPFYAGWGCTQDQQSTVRRRARRSSREIFAAAYLHYARYVDPITGDACDIKRTIELLAEGRRVNVANRGTTICLGMQRWKRRHLRPFLASTGGRTLFARNGQDALRRGAVPGDRILVWGERRPKGLEMLAEQLGGPVGRVEDGFLRSVGLGSDFVRPYSLAIDWHGAYYDPTGPSDLETLLATAEFDASLMARAASSRQRIAEAGLSKYNMGRAPIARPMAAGRQVLLVPGQVEDDVSVRLGCWDVRGNLDLVRAVRENNPDAYIAFKPHPDVVARNRAGTRSMAAIAELCDAVWTGANIHECLELADEVHVMTSLTGFEALLRGKKVAAYGGPFYAGWGLTEDSMEFPRRNRVLSIDELVAGALILYPRYYDWKSGTVCDCEAIVARLAGECLAAPAPADATPLLRPDRLVRRLGRLIRETVHA